jgi:hypothetical protein
VAPRRVGHANGQFAPSMSATSDVGMELEIGWVSGGSHRRLWRHCGPHVADGRVCNRNRQPPPAAAALRPARSRQPRLLWNTWPYSPIRCPHHALFGQVLELTTGQTRRETRSLVPPPPYCVSAVVGQALGWTNASSEKPRRETTPRKLLGSRAAVVPTRLLPSRVVRRLACDGCEADGPRRPRAAVDGGGARKETSGGGDMGCVR